MRVIPVGNLARQDGNQRVLYQTQLDLFVLRDVHKREEQPGQRRNYVPVHIIDLECPHFIDRKHNPVVPSSAIVVDLDSRITRHLLDLIDRPGVLTVHELLVLVLGRKRDGDVPEVFHVLGEQIAVEGYARPRLHKVHQVKRDRVLGDVVIPHDLDPILRKLLHECVVHIIVRLIDIVPGGVEYLALLYALAYDLMRFLRDPRRIDQFLRKQ